MRTLILSMVEAGLATGEAATDAAVTVAHRTPILAACLIRPSAEGLAEWQEAASEKVAAAWDGTVALWAAWQAAALSALEAPITPLGMADYSLQFARVATDPARARVRANAARFNGR